MVYEFKSPLLKEAEQLIEQFFMDIVVLAERHCKNRNEITNQILLTCNTIAEDCSFHTYIAQGGNILKGITKSGIRNRSKKIIKFFFENF